MGAALQVSPRHKSTRAWLRALTLLVLAVLAWQWKPPFALAAQGGPQASQILAEAGYRIELRRDGSGWELSLTVPPPRRSRIALEGRNFDLIQFDRAPLVASPTGEAVPVLTLPFRAAQASKPTLQLVNAAWESLGALHLLPFSYLNALPDSGLTGVEKRTRHQPGHAFGDPEVVFAGTFRGVRLVHIRIPLLRRSSSGYERLRRVTLLLDGLRPAAEGQAGIRSGNPAPNVSDLSPWILNPTETVSATAPVSLPQPQQPGKLRLVARDSGLYRLTGEDLAAAGVPSGTVLTDALKLVCRGLPLPYLFRGDANGTFDANDTLFFYVPALHGDTCFVYPYADSQIVWLDWNTEPGPKFHPEEVSQVPGVPEDTTFLAHLHLEEERTYYDGDTDLSIKVTDPVPGEGWVWKLFYPDDSWRIRFRVEDLALSASDSAIVRVRVRGTTLGPTNPDHHLVVQLNGHTIGEAFFNDRDERILRMKIPVDMLREGENELLLRSVKVPDVYISQFYLDWIEVAYPRVLVLRHGSQLEARLQAGQTPVTFVVAADTTVDPLFFDLEAGSWLQGVSDDRSVASRLRILSAGYDDGNTCRIDVGGRTVVQGGHRGHNLVVLDPNSGSVKDVRWFDTYADTSEANALADYVASLPESAVVLAAIRDEGSAAMTEKAHLALQSLGSALSRQVGIRDSWCLLGRKGAQPGTVPEIWKPRGSGAAEIDTVLTFPRGVRRRFKFTLPAGRGMHLLAVDRNGVPEVPRLELDKVDDLADSTRGADELIVTHRRFLSEAEKLAQYRRQHDGFRVAVVDVQDIYDAFNWGLKDPEAIRNFVTYVFWKWQKPSLRYLLLFGDASWDFHETSEGARFHDYVPSYGHPVSDSRYACVDGPNDRLPDLATGRIAVEDPAEAEEVVQKILEYERQPPAPWVKRTLLINGGFDHFEQTLFGQQSQRLAERYLKPPPASLTWTTVSKKTEGYYEGEGREDIARAINHGVLWVNFIGHAGSRTWDLMYHGADVDQLENAPAFPFVTSMTCHTARFANPYQESFGEHFVNAASRGAVGFVGTSGWGYVYQDEIYAQKLFSVAFQDTVRALGDITWLAKLAYWNVVGEGTLSQLMVDQYTLLGDPATRLVLPDRPDLAVTSEDVVVLPDRPRIADSTALVRVKVHNWGLATPDSVLVEITDSPESGLQKPVVSTRLGPVGLVDSVDATWNLGDEAGRHVLTATVSADSAREVTLSNNTAEKWVEVARGGAEARWPPPCAVLPEQDEPRLELQVSPDFLNATFEQELDTLATFDSDFLKRGTFAAAEDGRIVWRPGLLPTGLYWWRFRTVGDSSWSTQRFRVASLPPGQVGWQQKGPDLGVDSREGIVVDEQGAHLSRAVIPIRVESAGYEDGNYARIFVNGVPVMETSRGHNVAVVSPEGVVLRTRTFDLWKYSDQADSLAVFLAEVDTGYYVAAAIRDEGATNANETVFRAYESIGSALCRRIGLRDSWAIWGKKGMLRGEAREVLKRRGSGAAIILDSLTVLTAQGTLESPWIGPGQNWSDLQLGVRGSGEIGIVVLGRASLAAHPDTLARLRTASGDIRLAPGTARWVRLVADFQRHLADTTRLSSWSLTYHPPSDVVSSDLVVTPENVGYGKTCSTKVTVRNLGPGFADSCVVRLQIREASGAWRDVVSPSKIGLLPPDSSKLVRWTWQVREAAGNHLLRAVVDPGDRLVELDESNNTANATLTVLADTTAPKIFVYESGHLLLDGDYVSPTPELEVRILDQGVFTQKDTARLRVMLDDRRLSASSEPPLIWHLEAAREGKVSAVVRFSPELAPGSHILNVAAWDLAGNRTEDWRVLHVADKLEISHLLNYPNPFANFTTFTYFLSLPADEVVVRVFTLSGKLVWQRETTTCSAGYNALEWDGRDAEGDLLANGIYLVKVTARLGDKTVSALNKLAIVR